MQIKLDILGFKLHFEKKYLTNCSFKGMLCLKITTTSCHNQNNPNPPERENWQNLQGYDSNKFILILIH